MIKEEEEDDDNFWEAIKLRRKRREKGKLQNEGKLRRITEKTKEKLEQETNRIDTEAAINKLNKKKAVGLDKVAT